MEAYLHYKKQFTVAVDEVDFRERLKISAILQYFQDLATIHAEEIGIGYQAMRARNLVWVLNRVSARIHRYPQSEETILAVTYPRKPHMVDAVRDYYIFDSQDRLLVNGTSKWCLLDADSHAIRRVAPIFPFSPEVYNPTDALIEGCPKIERSEAHLPFIAGDVGVTDLDRNLHVNNARYGDMILNACGLEWLSNHTVTGFDINYLAELKYGERYEVYGKGDRTYMEGITQTGGEIFRATIDWAENDLL